MAQALPDDPAVRAVFEAQSGPLRIALLDLREQILAAAAATPRIGDLVETLKWGEPAYLPRTPRTGTTVRINAVKGATDRYGTYFHCQTTLLQSFRHLYPDSFTFEGDRAILFHVGETIPTDALRHCLTLALTYHLREPAPAKAQAG